MALNLQSIPCRDQRSLAVVPNCLQAAEAHKSQYLSGSGTGYLVLIGNLGFALRAWPRVSLMLNRRGIESMVFHQASLDVQQMATIVPVRSITIKANG